MTKKKYNIQKKYFVFKKIQFKAPMLRNLYEHYIVPERVYLGIKVTDEESGDTYGLIPIDNHPQDYDFIFRPEGTIAPANLDYDVIETDDESAYLDLEGVDLEPSEYVRMSKFRNKRFGDFLKEIFHKEISEKIFELMGSIKKDSEIVLDMMEEDKESEKPFDQEAIIRQIDRLRKLAEERESSRKENIPEEDRTLIRETLMEDDGTEIDLFIYRVNDLMRDLDIISKRNPYQFRHMMKLINSMTIEDA